MFQLLLGTGARRARTTPTPHPLPHPHRISQPSDGRAGGRDCCALPFPTPTPLSISVCSLLYVNLERGSVPVHMGNSLHILFAFSMLLQAYYVVGAVPLGSSQFSPLFL